MDTTTANQLVAYLTTDALPKKFKSNKSNFIAMAGNYHLNKKNTLMRNNKPVVTKNMQQEIYSSLHNHSGRTATWERIKAR